MLSGSSCSPIGMNSISSAAASGDLRQLQTSRLSSATWAVKVLDRRDRDLDAAPRVQRRIDLARDLRAIMFVMERRAAALAREPDRVDGVRDSPDCDQADHERVLREDGVAEIHSLAMVGLDRDARTLSMM